MDDAIFETMQKQEDNVYTEKIFKEKLKEAEPQEAEVFVNYRKEEGKWVFGGSNSQLQAGDKTPGLRGFSGLIQMNFFQFFFRQFF